MKLSEIKVGRTYRVLPHGGAPGKSERAVGRGTKATAVELGKRYIYLRHDLPGVEFELLEPAVLWTADAEAGARLVLPARSVLAEWTDADDEYRARMADGAARRRTLLDSLIAVGMTEEVRRFGRLKSEQRGVTVTGAVVSFHRETFEAWWKGVEPMSVAGSAIEAFVEELHRAGLLAESAMADVELSRAAALAEVRAGLAVTPAELAVAE